jgi:hypothetical protein
MTPSTKAMTKKGAPSTDGSVSYHRTAGTGTAVCVAIVTSSWCCASKAASGKSV